MYDISQDNFLPYYMRHPGKTVVWIPDKSFSEKVKSLSKGKNQTMTDKHQCIISARNHSYELMLTAQALRDRVDSAWEKMIADSLYDANWATYTLCLELERIEKKKAQSRQGNDTDKTNKTNLTEGGSHID